MCDDTLYHKGYIKGYWDGVKDTVSGKVADIGKSDISQLPVKAMSISVRACNCLIYYGCTHVGDVIALSSDSILRMRNLGPKTAAEIAQWLVEHGILCSAWSEYVL